MYYCVRDYESRSCSAAVVLGAPATVVEMEVAQLSHSCRMYSVRISTKVWHSSAVCPAEQPAGEHALYQQQAAEASPPRRNQSLRAVFV